MSQKWTEWEAIMVTELKNSGKSIREIAASTGRTYGSIDTFLRRDRITEVKRRRQAGEHVRRVNVQNVAVPQFLIAERDRRSQERAEMTEASRLMGEPVPSQSALARRA